MKNKWKTFLKMLFKLCSEGEYHWYLKGKCACSTRLLDIKISYIFCSKCVSVEQFQTVYVHL